MDETGAVKRILLGESLASIAADYRLGLLRDGGLDPEEATPTTFAGETASFMKRLCRQLGEKCSGDRRVLSALRDWLRREEHYEAYDALLTHFEFDGKDAVIRRGRMLFAGPMTAHWR